MLAELFVGFPDEHRLYFRRLSQTTQTDVLLGNLDTTGSGKVLLRPLTVQERIRELNLRARMFTETMLAIQTGGSSPRHSPLPGPRSLQVIDTILLWNVRVYVSALHSLMLTVWRRPMNTIFLWNVRVYVCTLHSRMLTLCRRHLTVIVSKTTLCLFSVLHCCLCFCLWGWIIVRDSTFSWQFIWRSLPLGRDVTCGKWASIFVGNVQHQVSGPHSDFEDSCSIFHWNVYTHLQS